MGCPLMQATAASVETRVRVERLLKSMATVLPVIWPWRDERSPDLMAFFAALALLTRIDSSWLVRSEILRKWRGLVVEAAIVNRVSFTGVCGGAGQRELKRVWVVLVVVAVVDVINGSEGFMEEWGGCI